MTVADAIRKIDPQWLPAGWSFDAPEHWPSIVYIERPRDAGGGAVSLDFKLRVWNSGIQLPRSFPDGVERSYSGRGWQRSMVGDACAWLERVMTRASGAQASDGGKK